MPIPGYTPNYPPDGSSLGQTKAVIRNNLDGTFQTLGVDHINNNGDPGAQPAGYHKVTHMVPQGSDPAPDTGYGQLYSKNINSVINDTALFWETSTGLIQQLTMNITPSQTTTGYTFIPGGILVQWGFVNSTNHAYTIQSFNIPFPTRCLGVFTQVYSGATEPNGEANVSLLDTGILVNQFSWSFVTGSSAYTGFYWIAIGK